MMHKLVKSQSCIPETNVTFYVNHTQIVKKKMLVGGGGQKESKPVPVPPAKPDSGPTATKVTGLLEHM